MANNLIGLHTGIGSENTYHSVVPPIYTSTNFNFPSLTDRPPFDYSRSRNPNRQMLGEALATLEEGTTGIVLNSGMAALTLLCLALVPKDGRIVAPHDAYGGTWRLLNELSARGIHCDFVDLTNVENAKRALSRHTDLVILESPSNPLLRITDITAVADYAHQAGGVVAVDNTFASPVLQQPLKLGADIVVHSTTKFINGHSDVVGGALITKDAELGEKLNYWSNVIGCTASAVDSWMTLRGLRTLAVRMRQHLANTQQLVGMLSLHDSVKTVYYPGLSDHPGHALATQQMSAPGALVSFELKGGREAVDRFLDGLEVFNLAESLGGIESLVAHPATMTHAAMPKDVQDAAGITEGLLRLSVGIEPTDVLVNDLQGGLDRALIN